MNLDHIVQATKGVPLGSRMNVAKEALQRHLLERFKLNCSRLPTPLSSRSVSWRSNWFASSLSFSQLQDSATLEEIFLRAAVAIQRRLQSLVHVIPRAAIHAANREDAARIPR